jgi:hypothetical protein
LKIQRRFDFARVTNYPAKTIGNFDMSFTAKQIKQLQTIIASAEELLKGAGAGSKATTRTAGKPAATRKRRVGKELAAFRKMLAAERANGVPVAEIAATHGVSSAYVYQIPVGRKSSVKSTGKVAKKAAKQAATQAAAPDKAPKRAAKKAAKKATKTATKKVAGRKGAVKALAGRKASGGKSAGKSTKSAKSPVAQQVTTPAFDPASI